MEDIVAFHTAMAVAGNLANTLILVNGHGILAGGLDLRGCLVPGRSARGARLCVGQGGSATIALLLVVVGLFKLTVLLRDTLANGEQRSAPGRTTYRTSLKD